MAQITLNSTGVASDGALLLQSNGTTTAVTINTAQNVGVGVTPSAWNTGVKAIEGTSDFKVMGGLTFDSLSNAYLNTSNAWIYRATGSATFVRQTSGEFRFFNAASGTAGNAISWTQAMTLDASGNLGIGTSSPAAPLHVSGVNLDTNAFRMVSTTGTNAVAGAFINTGGSAYIGLDNSTGSRISGSSGAGYALAVWHVGAYPVVFGTSNAERARITSGGDLLVGTTTAGAGAGSGRLTVESNSSAISIPVAFSDLRTDTASSNLVAIVRRGVQVGAINTTSTATSYATSSDYRLKNSIVPMTGALARVAALKPVTYKWNSDESAGEGFIAHELAEVCPHAVNGEKDAVDADGNPQYQGIDTSFLVATLTAAIQEQQSIIQTLTDRITALEQA